MLNEAGGTVIPEQPPRPRFRFRPQPVAIFPWVFAFLTFIYASRGGSSSEQPGKIILSHYPAIVEGAKAILAGYWFVTAGYLIGKLLCTPEAQERRAQIITGFFVMACALSYGLLHFLIRGQASDLFLLAPACGLLAIVSAAVVSGRVPRAPMVAITISILATVPLGYVDMPNIWGGWRDMTSVRVPEGKTYHVLHYSVLMGRQFALTEEVVRGPLYLHTRVVGVVGESDSSLSLPQSSVPARPFFTWEGQLVLTPDARWLLYLRRSSYDPSGIVRVDLAYDRWSGHLFNAGMVKSQSGLDKPKTWTEVVKVLDSKGALLQP